MPPCQCALAHHCAAGMCIQPMQAFVACAGMCRHVQACAGMCRHMQAACAGMQPVQACVLRCNTPCCTYFLTRRRLRSVPFLLIRLAHIVRGHTRETWACGASVRSNK